MKIAVIRANGQLGSDVVSAFSKDGADVCALTHSDIEVIDANALSRTLTEIRPKLIINTSAMHHVENYEQAPEKAFAVNAIRP